MGSDGSALRALALIPYANFLLDRDYHTDIDYVSRHLYDPAKLRELGKVIKNDLEEVGGGWWNPGFDLWEEV
jgi:glucoamylase